MHPSRISIAIAIALAIACVAGAAAADSAAELDREATAALEHLYRTTPAAKTLGKEAVGILVFPKIHKAGFIFAGEFGVGALRKGGVTAGYYNIAEVSAGYQAGVEEFSYALFFMTEKALAYLDKSAGRHEHRDHSHQDPAQHDLVSRISHEISWSLQSRRRPPSSGAPRD